MFFEPIIDSSVGYENKPLSTENMKLRTAARGIILNKDTGEIGIFYKKNMNQYKLPGGGIDEGENPEEAFVREVYEETGCTLESNLKFLGITTEIKSAFNFIQNSFAYLGIVKSQSNELHLTEKEIKEGGEFLWLKPEVAISLMEDSFDKLTEGYIESLYSTTFVVKRDILIIKNYLKVKDII